MSKQRTELEQRSQRYLSYLENAHYSTSCCTHSAPQCVALLLSNCPALSIDFQRTFSSVTQSSNAWSQHLKNLAKAPPYNNGINTSEVCLEYNTALCM